ncbi:MAG: SGNH/GDSL hydrolase family protein, partial [Gemmatimonadetes bacterium]|nr:SGNH/GDSL hydrolase family protein [Gemmatimonadota bacterium]
NQTITEAELAMLEDITEDYNDVILREANSRGWGHVDAYTELLALPGDPTDLASFAQLNRIFAWDGSQQNPYSAFSLDGVHPSEKGHARTANLFIRELNATFGLGIPAVDEEAIFNVTGFELSPGFVPPRGGKNAMPFLDENARRNLDAFSSLSQRRQRLPFLSSN